MNLKNFILGFLLPLTCMIAGLAHANSDALTDLRCEANQSLWIYELGNRGTSVAPNSEHARSYTRDLQLWKSPNQEVLVGSFSNLPRNITHGKILERFTPLDGKDTIILGELEGQWPPHHSGLERADLFTPHASSLANNFTTELERTNFRLDGKPTIEIIDYLSRESFDGRLFYYIEQAAGLEYLRLAVCSDAAISTNKPPIANKVFLDVEATSETTAHSIADNFSDPDKDTVTVSIIAKNSPPLSYTLSNSGILTLKAPSVTGEYSFPYEVKDSKAASTFAEITVTVTLPESVRLNLENQKSKAAALLAEIADLRKKLETLSPTSDELIDRREKLLIANQALEQSNGHKLLSTAGEISQLTKEIKASKNNILSALKKVGETEGQFNELKTRLKFLEIQTGQNGVNLMTFESNLATLALDIENLKSKKKSISIPKVLTPVQMSLWEKKHESFKQTSPNWRLVAPVSLALFTLTLITALSLKLRRRIGSVKPPRHSSFTRDSLKPPETSHQNGTVFPHSPLLAGAIAPGPAPLAPMGQMVSSGLQTLTGQYSTLKLAYLATGRIGGPQEGVPTNDDVAFGTGFLITPNHVMTNQHVYEFYKHYLTGPECGGIEFIAERDRDASDYVPFNGEPPLILPDLDIAIFTLARSVTDRKPIERIAIPTEELNEREVITISYPCPFEVDEIILSVVEDNPIFAVKRLSQGNIFKHSSDIDKPYGVEVKVGAHINPSRSLTAICHNASTLGGSSGAPILDMKGHLVGVHFAGDRAFNGQEAANLAMAIEELVKANSKNIEKGLA